jgi:hypothetical protein
MPRGHTVIAAFSAIEDLTFTSSLPTLARLSYEHNDL